jgi:hypothetical protein
MASGLLARVRAFHPDCDLFIYTNAASRSSASRLARQVGATDLICPAKLDYDCGQWDSIVQAKFQLLGQPYSAPIVFLDVDQVLYCGLEPFVSAFAESGAMIGGSPDDETLAQQFEPGCVPSGVTAEMAAINTGAFIVHPDRTFYRLVIDALPYFEGRARLPTQAVINGVVHAEKLPVRWFGDEFMAGPFSGRVLEVPRRCALIHFWSPRPPFMFPNVTRAGERSYHELKREFEQSQGAPYPEAQLEGDYRSQLMLGEALAGGEGKCLR